MEQYQAIKKKCSDSILFFRMGDFYEMFYDDAKVAAQVLGLTLTSRAHGKTGDVPLAGFPHHALDVYLTKMLKSGYKVAICEQTEDPKMAKGIVKREIIEKVSPGTTYSEKILEEKVSNYLLSIYNQNNLTGLAAVDVSTGNFWIGEGGTKEMRHWIENIRPTEILVPESERTEISQWTKDNTSILISTAEDYIFAFDYARETLLRHFQVVSLKGFGCDSFTCALSAAGGLLHYLRQQQSQHIEHIQRMRPLYLKDYIFLDSTTQRCLELVRPMIEGQSDSTLFSVLDKTLTPMGGRLLKHWILYPLRSENAIRKRLDGVEELLNSDSLRSGLSNSFKGLGDLERLAVRISTNRANARDLLMLAHALDRLPGVKSLLQTSSSEILKESSKKIKPLENISKEIHAAIQPEPPLSVTDGGIIKTGYNAELDEIRKIESSGKQWIASLQNEERKKTGINSLKVNYNRVIGYYIEVTKTHLSKVPENYIRKQSLVNAERFITPELKEYEEKVLQAEERMASLEYEIFQSIRKNVTLELSEIQKNAQIIAGLDCLLSFAITALKNSYCKPIVQKGEEILIEGGRHPVVEMLLPPGEQFISNDTKLTTSHDQIHIITGPNMAGKSTYLRQVGIIILMAQIGSFVPAKAVSIGIVDRIFTRVGATDNVARGESTFLIEMYELANILHNATPESLILLDEIGRGTSTFDGLSIAWAAAEFLHNTRSVAAKTLFASHYHELTELERIYPRIKNYNVSVKEWGDQIVFLRKIVPGGCDHSYGIHVAQMAGVPDKVITRSKEILKNL